MEAHQYGSLGAVTRSESLATLCPMARLPIQIQIQI